MCDTTYFRVDYVINPYMDVAVQPDRIQARREHDALVETRRAAGRVVRRIPPALKCPDMVYTANVAFVADDPAAPPRPEITGPVRRWRPRHGTGVVDCRVRLVPARPFRRTRV
jgi:hypothetical protein